MSDCASIHSMAPNDVVVIVTYPAERFAANSIVRCRVGKKSVRPPMSSESRQHLVQFNYLGKTSLLLVSDILASGFLQRIRNAYTFSGKMEIDEQTKLSREETARIVNWLKERRRALGLEASGPEVLAEVHA